MTVKDLHNNISVQQLLNPVVISGAAATIAPDAVFDTRGANSAEVLVAIGESGDTLSGSLKLEFVLKHGDLADMTDAVVIDDANHVLATTYSTSTGIFATIDAAAEDDTYAKIGYVGPKRYLQVQTIKTGTHTNGTPVAILGVLSDLHQRPAA